MRVAITNIGTIVSGDWRAPLVPGDTIITQDEKIASVGTASARDVERCDVVIDAGGATAIPGLIAALNDSGYDLVGGLDELRPRADAQAYASPSGQPAEQV